MSEPTVNADHRAAVRQLMELLHAGAELEMRELDGTPVKHDPEGRPDCVWPLAHDAIQFEEEPDTPDGRPVLWLCGLYRNLIQRTEDGKIAFDGSGHQMRPLTVEQFDLLEGGAVGIRHPDRKYSVVRAATRPERRALIDAWRDGPLLY